MNTHLSHSSYFVSLIYTIPTLLNQMHISTIFVSLLMFETKIFKNLKLNTIVESWSTKRTNYSAKRSIEWNSKSRLSNAIPQYFDLTNHITLLDFILFYFSLKFCVIYGKKGLNYRITNSFYMKILVKHSIIIMRMNSPFHVCFPPWHFLPLCNALVISFLFFTLFLWWAKILHAIM